MLRYPLVEIGSDQGGAECSPHPESGDCDRARKVTKVMRLREISAWPNPILPDKNCNPTGPREPDFLFCIQFLSSTLLLINLSLHRESSPVSLTSPNLDRH